MQTLLIPDKLLIFYPLLSFLVSPMSDELSYVALIQPSARTTVIINNGLQSN